MTAPKKTHAGPHDEVIGRNPKVDVVTVDGFRRLEGELAKLGVVVKPVYRIDPPLGSSRFMTHNRAP